MNNPFDGSFDLGSIYDTAANVGSGGAFDTPRTSETYTRDAITSGQPIEPAGNAGNAWGGFWQNTIGSIAGYAMARDMQGRQVQQGQQQAQTTVAVRRAGGNNVILLAGAGLLAYVLLAKGVK